MTTLDCPRDRGYVRPRSNFTYVERTLDHDAFGVEVRPLARKKVFQWAFPSYLAQIPVQLSRFTIRRHLITYADKT